MMIKNDLIDLMAMIVNVTTARFEVVFACFVLCSNFWAFEDFAFSGNQCFPSFNMCDFFLDTRYIKMFILDEADEMLSRGFKDQIYDVFRTLNESIQVCREKQNYLD